MRLYFENTKGIAEGLAEVAPELGISLVRMKADAEITVCIKEVPERMLNVSLDGNTATITYGDGYARFFRALAILVEAIRRGEPTLNVTERPLFETNGAMVDMSRNAVMNVQTVKFMLRKMALMGMNSFQLYVEDTYEVEEYPYFGYMRGRYTHEELKEMDRYARLMGIELIPCIQVLGHLSTHLRWGATASYKDTDRVLLVGAEETYRLIESMIQTLAACFTSRRVHIGMDETGDLGVGKYLAKNGYRERHEIYFEHLERVSQIVRKYGFEPMMWSDMFFRMAGKGIPGYEDYDLRVQFTEEYINSIPKNVKQVYWDYYHDDENFYATNIEKHHTLFGNNVMFAGGVWLWSGHCPIYSESLRNTIPALEACRKKGIRDVLATVWLNGAEGSLILSLAGLAWYADFDYVGHYDEASVKDCFTRACGVSYDDMMRCELPEHPDHGRFSLSRALLYNDPLLGIVDKHFKGLEMESYYQSIQKELDAIPADCGTFSSAIEVIRRLTAVLLHKADFGLRLKTAYDQKDREVLAAMAAECDTVVEKLKELRLAHRKAWMEYNKSFGWEVHDIRYGGLIARFDTVKARIAAYLAGEIAQIEELEAERLFLHAVEEENPLLTTRFFWHRFGSLITAGIL